MYLLYNLLWLLLLPLMMLFLGLKKLRQEQLHCGWRFGFYSPGFLKAPKSTKRIWVHAASVGEINAICSFIKQLREEYPQAWIGISTMTPTGLATAKSKIPEANQHFIVPLDFFWSARRSMQFIRPDLLITIETELWPNLLKYAKLFGASVLMVNGRISARKIALYLKWQKFFKKVLAAYDFLSMISAVDAERIIAMGAAPDKVSINGNLKFDSIAQLITNDYRSIMRSTLHLTGAESIWVAGSTREGEEELIIEAFLKIRQVFPNLILIIAPRHIHRSSEIVDLVKKYGFKPVLRSEITEQTLVDLNTIIVLNTMGELSKVYSIATLVFCGASLVPLGGQNPLEAAVWGKVVLYGTSMEDFLDAKKLLEEAGAGIQVNNPDNLAQQVILLLSDIKKRNQLGELGKKAVLAQSGSTIRNIEMVKKFLVH